MQVGLPVFTVKDDDLVRSSSARDPMGLLGVWRTGLGRALVPNLSASVTRLDGVIGVLFIHYMFESVRKIQSDVSRSKVFRCLEGLFQYWLKEKKETPIFGVRALADPNLFEIDSEDPRTVANGLRQYYQGTCIRAGLLQSTNSLSEDGRRWCQEALKPIPPVVNSLLQLCVEGRKRAVAVRQNHSELYHALDSFISDERWKTWLCNSLLGEGATLEFARLCGEYHINQHGGLKQALDQIQRHAKPRFREKISLVTKNIKRCEPFLVWCQVIFDWLQQQDRVQFSRVVGQLRQLKDDIISAAKNFASITDSNYHTSRFLNLLKVAEASLFTEKFLQIFLEYHKNVMKERGEKPLVCIEGGQIYVNDPIGGSIDLISVSKDIAEGRWLNDYYMTAAGKIYSQTKGGACNG